MSRNATLSIMTFNRLTLSRMTFKRMTAFLKGKSVIQQIAGHLILCPNMFIELKFGVCITDLYFKNVAQTKTKCLLTFSMTAIAECFVLF